MRVVRKMPSRKMSAERTLGRKPRADICTGAHAAAAIASPPNASARRTNRLKDEVYREMLRLESNRPGSEMGLALALLRAALQRDSLADDMSFQQWLNEVCTLGLKMIEASLNERAHCASAG